MFRDGNHVQEGRHFKCEVAVGNWAKEDGGKKGDSLEPVQTMMIEKSALRSLPPQQQREHRYLRRFLARYAEWRQQRPDARNPSKGR